MVRSHFQGQVGTFKFCLLWVGSIGFHVFWCLLWVECMGFIDFDRFCPGFNVAFWIRAKRNDSSRLNSDMSETSISLWCFQCFFLGSCSASHHEGTDFVKGQTLSSPEAVIQSGFLYIVTWAFDHSNTFLGNFAVRKGLWPHDRSDKTITDAVSLALPVSEIQQNRTNGLIQRLGVQVSSWFLRLFLSGFLSFFLRLET